MTGDEHTHYWSPVPAYRATQGESFRCTGTSGGVTYCPALWIGGHAVEHPDTTTPR